MPDYDLSYTYDPVGNRKTMTNNLTGEVTTYTYDRANQLVDSVNWSGTTTYDYDGAGNQTLIVEPSGDRTTKMWDDENRNKGIIFPNGSRVTYVYSPDGRLFRKET